MQLRTTRRQGNARFLIAARGAKSHCQQISRRSLRRGSYRRPVAGSGRRPRCHGALTRPFPEIQVRRPRIRIEVARSLQIRQAVGIALALYQQSAEKIHRATASCRLLLLQRARREFFFPLQDSCACSRTPCPAFTVCAGESGIGMENILE